MQLFGRNRYGPKIVWGLCPFGGGAAGSPSNTCGRGRGLRAKFHLDPSNRLATVHERYRQIDNGPIAYGEPFYKRSPKNLVKFGHAVFQICDRTDRQTDILIAIQIRLSQYFAPFPEAKCIRIVQFATKLCISTSLSRRTQTARRSAPRPACCKQRWTFGVITSQRSN